MSATIIAAQAAIDHCRSIARFTDEPGATTRTFLGAGMRGCLNYLIQWARRMGVGDASVDPAGNFRATLRGTGEKRLLIGSHLDTVPEAGAFDGVLGVVLGMVLAEMFTDQRPSCTLEVVGFSEEEGVRFGRPFIGSRGLMEGLNDEFLSIKDKAGISVAEAINGFGLDASRAAAPQLSGASAYLEFHIEQGPLLESVRLPLGVVAWIAGQTRAMIRFHGSANHAGTTPMHLRRDAFCAAAEWTLSVEEAAREVEGLVATVGTVQLSPGVTNVVPGAATLSLDIRHAQDEIRTTALAKLLQKGADIAARRRLEFSSKILLDQQAVQMDADITGQAARAVASTGIQPLHMTSGAGHDAVILAKHLPSAMIFLRSPGGVSHHPDEDVLVDDVRLALSAGRYFVENFI